MTERPPHVSRPSVSTSCPLHTCSPDDRDLDRRDPLDSPKIDPIYESVVILAFISYFFIYLLPLLRIIDHPFRVDERTMDDVSLFLLNEFERSLDRG